jgi:intracellular sulfur oxidation DsrE/DsrF family protein
LWPLCASSGLIAGGTSELPRAVVYHIDDSERAIAMLRNINNHHAADPTIRIVVVALGAGVDFLLDGHADDRANSYDALVDPLMLEGVEFRVCGNTLKARHIDAATLLPDVQIVPSGVAEIARLQIAEGAAYIKP